MSDHHHGAEPRRVSLAPIEGPLRLLVIVGAAALFLAVFLIAPHTAYARDELKNNDPDKYYILLDLKNSLRVHPIFV